MLALAAVRRCLVISAGYKDLLTTLFITIVFDLKSNAIKGLHVVEQIIIIMTSVLRVLICFPQTKNLLYRGPSTRIHFFLREEKQ